MQKLDSVLLEKASLAKQPEADRVHTLSEAHKGRKRNAVAQIDRDCVVVGYVRITADSAGECSWQIEQIQFQQKGQAQGEQTGVRSGVQQHHVSDRLTIRCGEGCEGQRAKGCCSLRMRFIW